MWGRANNIPHTRFENEQNHDAEQEAQTTTVTKDN